ncbi:AgmX/PglI C-terminal domain-containing protein [Aquabacterium sp.]|uniref:AgmX/PglI C-terminal domain-containing protein n=1 Tax=Aquabacterium sp. TaxID=1872578 RepID=UPI002E2F04F8|nr:AgmX/PglI C-terminal domain-containing protein [Aquabacterium sp.]HEX5311816.1 AgmX/PglI C-terminal domain-containing protein [Aquabacterium sp.]
MSAATLVSFRSSDLAWTDSPDDQRLFRRVTGAVLLVTTGLCLSLLLSPVRKAETVANQPLPAPMAKLLLEHTPPPPVEKPKAPEVPEAPAKAQPETTAQPKPAQAQAPRKAAPAPDATRPAVVSTGAPVAESNQAAVVEAARKRVAGMGLLAASDDIAQVRGGSAGVQIKTDIRQGSGQGVAGAPVAGPSDGSALARAMITSNASGGSGSLNTGPASRSVSSGGLAGRATTVVVDDTAARAAAGAAKRAAASAAAKAPRSPEDIRMVLARNKGALDAIYNRALREDPTLQGKVVFEIKVAPTGEVLSCKVVFSDLHSPALEAKLVARIRMIDFGAKDVDVTTEKYPLDFLPS